MTQYFMESGAVIQLCYMKQRPFWLNTLNNEVKAVFGPIPYSLEPEINNSGHFKCSVTHELKSVEIRLAYKDDVLLYGTSTVLPGLVLDKQFNEKEIAKHLDIGLADWLQFEELLLLQINDGGNLQGDTIEVDYFDESDQQQTIVLQWQLL